MRRSAADVADEAAVDRLFELAQGQLGGVDILIDNAGIAGPTGRIEEIAPEDWRRTLEVDLTGQNLARAGGAAPQAGGRRLDRQLSSAAGRSASRSGRRTARRSGRWSG